MIFAITWTICVSFLLPSRGDCDDDGEDEDYGDGDSDGEHLNNPWVISAPLTKLFHGQFVILCKTFFWYEIW